MQVVEKLKLFLIAIKSKSKDAYEVTIDWLQYLLYLIESSWIVLSSLLQSISIRWRNNAVHLAVKHFVQKRRSVVISGVILIIGLLADIIGIVGILPKFQNSITPMSGEFNIAVVEFTANSADQEGRREAIRIVNSITSRLERYLAAESANHDVEFDVQVFNIKRNFFGYSQRKFDPIDAAELAKRVGAHIVIFGGITVNSQETSILSEIYIAERHFSAIPEFLGEHLLGRVISTARTDDAGRVETNQDVAKRVRSLSLIALALSFYSKGDYDSAMSFFISAYELGDWQDEKGNESIYLMLGNCAGKLEMFEDAFSYYHRALELNNQYARAYVGLGELHFRLALGAPTVSSFQDVSLVEIVHAQDQYNRAILAFDQPASADIDSKVGFGLARIALIRYHLSGLPDYRVIAETAFIELIDTYTNGNPRIQELAAQSYVHLGTLSFMSKDYPRAEFYYHSALPLVTNSSLKASTLTQLGDLYTVTGRLDEAITTYDEAILTAPDDKIRTNYRVIRDQLLLDINEKE